MKKITIKRMPFKLLGETISIGSALDIKAVTNKGKDINLKDIKGKKVISFFPDINTRICDAQTQSISKYAEKHPEVKFISITMDEPNTINKWCLANGISNIDIWSDRKYGDFGDQTRTFIPKLKKLCRGFMVLNNKNVIIDIAINKELSANPNYELIEKHLK